MPFNDFTNDPYALTAQQMNDAEAALIAQMQAGRRPPAGLPYIPPDMPSGMNSGAPAAAPPIPAPNPNFGGAQPPPELAAADAASAARVNAGAPMFNGFTPVGRNGVAGIRTNDPSAIFGGIPPGPGMQTTAAESNTPPIQAATVPDMSRQFEDIIARQLGPRPERSRYINGPADTREYDVRANALFNSLAQLAGVANQSGELNLHRIQTLGANGLPGTLARNQADIESMGLPRQQDLQGAQMFREAYAAARNNGAPDDEAIAAGNAARAALAGSRPPGAAAPLGASTPPPIPGAGPTNRIEQVYRTIQRTQSGVGPNQQAQARITNPGAGITELVNTLGENFVNENAPAVMRFIQDRFGAGAANEWFTQRLGILGNSPEARAIHALQGAANARGDDVGSSAANPESGWFLRLIAPLFNARSAMTFGGSTPPPIGVGPQ